MGVRHPEQDRYSEHETVLCVSGKPKEVRLCELNPESMDWESGSEERYILIVKLFYVTMVVIFFVLCHTLKTYTIFNSANCRF